MTQETIRKLNEMKLFGMTKGFEDQLASTSAGPLSFEERFGLLVDQEFTWRDNRRLQRLLQLAKLRENACMEDIDYRPGRGLDRAEMASLALGSWIRHGHNLILTGPTGGGKTWLACAIGNQACRHGLAVSFQRLPLLLEDLLVSHGDGSFRKRLMQLAKVDLLILDRLVSGSYRLVPSTRSWASSSISTTNFDVLRWESFFAITQLLVT